MGPLGQFEMKKKTIRRTLVKKLDEVFSKVVRQRTGELCPLCGQRPVQCAFHFISRNRKSVRWDFRNVIGSCHGCNMEERNDHSRFTQWYIDNYGERAYLELLRDSAQPRKWELYELEEMIERFKGELDG